MSDLVYSKTEIEQKLEPILKKHGIRYAILFGSYSKGNATPNSDIDLLVDIGLKGLSFVGFVEDVRESLDKDVDVLDITHVDKNSDVEIEINRTGQEIYTKWDCYSKAFENINTIQNYCKSSDYDSFCSNTMLVEACVFNLSQMGELVKNVDDEYKKEQLGIPWHQLYGLRNRIVHDYEGVNLKLVWQIIRDDLPSLQLKLEMILEKWD